MSTTVILALLGLAGTAISEFFRWRNNKDSDVKKQIQKAKIDELNKKISEVETELSLAMVNCLTDVPSLRMKLEDYRKQLLALSSVILLCLCCSFSGCKTDEPVIFGERILAVKPKDSIVVPELKSPAKQWYLIDDVAMLKVLGVDKPIERKTENSGINQK